MFWTDTSVFGPLLPFRPLRLDGKIGLNNQELGGPTSNNYAGVVFSFGSMVVTGKANLGNSILAASTHNSLRMSAAISLAALE